MGSIAQGDGVAFQQFFIRHGGLVLGVLMQLLRSRAQAERVLQDVFVELWERSCQYDTEHVSPRTRVLLLARSSALARLRGNAPGNYRQDRCGTEHLETSESPVADLLLEARESEGTPRRALEDLSDDERQCVTLSFDCGLTRTEIAAKLRIPLAQVNHRYLNGMRKLRSRFGPAQGRARDH